MPIGHVNATSINLRDAPDGEVLAILPQGAEVDIKLDDGSRWLMVIVSVDGQKRLGYVNASLVDQDDQFSTNDHAIIPKGFTEAVVSAAQMSQLKWGIPASVSLAQWALESAFGRSMPVASNNPFGIKAMDGQDFVEARTTESIGGRMQQVVARFRKFAYIAEAFDKHGQLLAQGAPYAKARALLPDADAFAQALTGVYATDPNYGAALRHIMQKFSLMVFDAPSPN